MRGSRPSNCRTAGLFPVVFDVCAATLTTTSYNYAYRTQVEYAIEAIKLGSTAVGIQTKEGVVLAVEKRLTSPLLEPSSVEKVGREGGGGGERGEEGVSGGRKARSHYYHAFAASHLLPKKGSSFCKQLLIALES